MKKLLAAAVISMTIVACSKKTEKCYECSQSTTVKEGLVIVNSDYATSTRCDVSQQTIDQETKEKTFVKRNGTQTTESKFECKLK